MMSANGSLPNRENEGIVMNARIFTATMAAALMPVFAMAQTSVIVPGAVSGYGYRSYYGNYYHAATPAEAYLNGRSRVIRAAGEYNLNTSAAMINLEEARSKYLDNQVKYVETYFEKRRLNKSYRAAERGPRITTETAARISQARQPGRLSAEELDRQTGRINWPLALQGDVFAPYRMRLETLFALQNSQDSGVNSASYPEIVQLTSAATSELKQRIRTMG